MSIAPETIQAIGDILNEVEGYTYTIDEPEHPVNHKTVSDKRWYKTEMSIEEDGSTVALQFKFKRCKQSYKKKGDPTEDPSSAKIARNGSIHSVDVGEAIYRICHSGVYDATVRVDETDETLASHAQEFAFGLGDTVLESIQKHLPA